MARLESMGNMDLSDTSPHADAGLPVGSPDPSRLLDGALNAPSPTEHRVVARDGAVGRNTEWEVAHGTLLTSGKTAITTAETSRAEANLLYFLSDAVNRAETLEGVYEPALTAVTGALRVERAAILLFDADGIMRFKAWHGLSSQYRQAVEGHSPWKADAIDPKPLIVENVLADPEWQAYRPVFEQEGIGAAGFIPLLHRRRLLGKFMIYSDQPRTFAERDLELAQTIATQISQAVFRTQLFEAERQSRATAERNAELVRRLLHVTASLSEAATANQVAEVIVTEGVTSTGATTGGLWRLNAERSAAELIHATGYTTQGQKDFSRIEFGQSVPTPATDALLQGQAVWIASEQEFRSRYPALAAAGIARPEDRIACLPIHVDTKCVAVLAFTFDKRGKFDDTERDFLLHVARQGSFALERAELLETERKGRLQAEAAHRRASFKADASAALAASLDYQTTLKNVARLAIPRFADFCAVEVQAADGQLTLVAVEHVNPAKLDQAWQLRMRLPRNPEEKYGVQRIMRTGKAELYEEIPDSLLVQRIADPKTLAIARSLELKSAIHAPIAIQGRTMGVITFIWAESDKRYDSADLDTAILIGQRAALAIDNARLHQDLQRAVKIREDLLAVVSHDLRNPLGVISMKAVAIERLLEQTPDFDKLRRHAEGIQAYVGKMEQLINDLLDLGNIEAGHLRIDPKPDNVVELIRTALDEMRPLAISKDIRLSAELPALPIDVLCDRRRILQVFSNLIGNALKFTPAGGAVTVRAATENHTMKICVSDTGCGIEQDHLTKIFERYYQGPAEEQRGVGLGLFIAQGVVAAHGGKIWAESTVGSGTQFYFTLPLVTNQASSSPPAPFRD